MNINDYDNIYILDCGKNTATISHNGNTCDIIKHSDILDLPKTLPENSLVVCEYAHLGCARQEYSLSQPFYAEQLLTLYRNFSINNIALKLFPQKSMPRASSYSKLPKGDMYDPIAIYRLLKDFPNISLMNPPKAFETTDLIKEFWKWKKTTNQILNAARMDKYDILRQRGDKNTEWILDNLQKIYDNISETAKDCFGFETYKKSGEIKTNTKNDWSFGMPQLYSILAILRDYNGKLRKRESTNDFLSNNHAKRYVLCMTPFHFKGGVARSNEYYHGAMNWIISKASDDGINLKRKVKEIDSEGKESSRRIRRGHFTPEEEQVFLTYRQQYSKSIMEIYRLFKSMLSEETNISSEGKKQISKKTYKIRVKQKQLEFSESLTNG